MENSKHTPGKIFQKGLYFKQEDGSPLGIGQCFVGSYSPTGNGGRMKANGIGEANAERIVTIWNAMDGLTNEEVKKAGEMYRKLIATSKREAEALK